MKAPKLPAEYRAAELTPGGYTKSTPRKWTEKEIEFIADLKKQGYTLDEIAESVDRTAVSVSIKLKRITKKADTYNEHHRSKKYAINKAYAQEIHPESVLDCFAGCRPYWNAENIKRVVTNDINKDYKTDYHLDALKLLCKEYAEGNKYDLVDLDPFGSAYDCLDLACKIAKKGLCVTLGEMGQKRWRRLDFIRTHYGIERDEDFTSENLVRHIQQIGLRNKKRLVVYALENWANISRVWFIIEPVKITEQWEKHARPTYGQQELEFNAQGDNLEPI